MVSFVSHTSTDCRDAYALSEWWKDVLGYVDVPGDPNEPGHAECMIVDPALARAGADLAVDPAGERPRLLFIEVPEAKEMKNRLHLDLRPADRDQDAEVTRLLALGATVVADRRGLHGPGTGWVVLADPEGNEFCVLRSADELARS